MDSSTDDVVYDLWIVNIVTVCLSFTVILINTIAYVMYTRDGSKMNEKDRAAMDAPLTDSAYALVKASTLVTVVFTAIMLLLTASPPLGAALLKSDEEGFSKSLRVKILLSLLAKIFVYSCFTRVAPRR